MVKCNCSLCGVEMTSYTKRHEMKTSFGTEISVGEVHPWYHAGNKVVCPKCQYIVETKFTKLDTIVCVECPINIVVVNVNTCHECKYNWGFAGTIDGIRCSYGYKEESTYGV